MPYFLYTMYGGVRHMLLRKPIKLPSNCSGIYTIVNLVTKHFYIGSSKDIRERFNHHKSELRNNKHANTYLQNSWNKYGELNFGFYVIEFCDEDKRYDREQYYIDLTNCCDRSIGFNIAEKVECPPQTEESRRKQSESLKENKDFMRFASEFMTNLHNDPEMKEKISNSVRNSEKVKETRRKLNESPEHKKQVQELLNRLHNDPKVQEHVKTLASKNLKNPSWRAKKLSPVLQYDLNGKFIREFESMKEAEKLGFDHGSIGAVCDGKYKQHKGYLWKRKTSDDYPKQL